MSAGTSSAERGRPELRGYVLAACAGVVALGALLGAKAVRGWDIWWHLLTGRLALETGSTLPVDVFSLTRDGEPWIYKDLGAEVVFWLLYDAFGPAGLSAFRIAAGAGLAALLLRLAWSPTRRAAGASANALAVGVVGVALLIASFRLIVRPESFSLLLLPVLLLLLEARRRDARRGPLLAIVALTLVWANLHRGVVLGAIVIWGHALYELAAGLWCKLRGAPPWWMAPASSRGARPLLAAAESIGAACLASAALFANPSGYHLVTQSLQVTGSEVLARVVSEWQRLDLAEMWRAFPVATLWIGAVVLLVPLALLFGDRRRPSVTLWDLGVCAVFLYLGAKAPRMLPLLAIATTPSMAGALATLAARLPAPSEAFRRPLPVTAAALVALLGFGTSAIEAPALGWAARWYPEGAVRTLQELGIERQGYTTYTFAGYVLFHLWPEQRVLCDGRFDTVYDEDTVIGCMAAPDNPTALAYWVNRFDLGWVLTHNRPGPSRDPAVPRSFDYLDVDPRWALVHWDETSLLYLRDLPENADAIEARAYRFLRPHDIDVSLREAVARAAADPSLREPLRAEVERLLAAAPDDYRALIAGALFYRQIEGPDSPNLAPLVRALELMRDLDPAIGVVLERVR
jgi:hypothetical protein